MFDLPERRRPTAFYTIADNLAVKVERYANLYGMAAPKDFSIVGVGASEIGRYALSSLTTMDENLQMYGINAVKLLLGSGTDLVISEQMVCRVQSSLIVRNSTAVYKEPERG